MRVFHLLQQAHSALFRAADHEMRTAEGITASQNAVLFLLAGSDGQRIGDLSRQLQMGKSSLTSLIERMIALGLVRREQNAEDGRVSNIFIEEAGLATVKRTAGSVRDINARLLAPFSAEEQETIQSFLTHVRQHAHDIVAPHEAGDEPKSI